jgi:DeoR/GlpR family transcriptional regulator of sugar metabolism
VFAEERQRAIVQKVREAGSVAVDELAEAFGVSAPTIRADLARLEGKGLLVRTHGGAIRAEGTLFEPSHDERTVMRHAEKQAIARAAARLVHPGETVLLDAGTTTLEVALALRDIRSLTVVTNSLANATVLMECPGIDVIMIGGQVQRSRRATLGPLATRFLDGFRVDRAFLGFNGVDADAGYTVIDFDAAEIKRRMLESGAQSVVVADSGKIGRVAFAASAPINAADLLITDDGAQPSHIARLREKGLEVQIVSAARD